MSQGNHKFCTTVNCMDGRAVEATINWMKVQYDLDYVDTISEPGMDGFISKMNDEQKAWLKRKLEISIKNHGSRTVSFVGHDDCAGNPVLQEEHLAHIAKGVAIVTALVHEIDATLEVAVFGLWAFPSNNTPEWTIEKV